MKARLRAAALFLIAVPLLVLGQAGNSTFTGTIADPSGAPIPGVIVTLSNLDTGIDLQTITNEAGVYRQGTLVPGNYMIIVETPGFNRLSRGPIILQVSQTLAIDLALQLGQVTETIDITEAAPLLETQSSDIGQAVNREMLASLPLPNRAASSLAALAPGVVMVDPGTGTAENYPVFTVAGGRV